MCVVALNVAALLVASSSSASLTVATILYAFRRLLLLLLLLLRLLPLPLFPSSASLYLFSPGQCTLVTMIRFSSKILQIRRQQH